MEKEHKKKKIWWYILIAVVVIFIGLILNMSYVQKNMLISTHKEILQILANEKAAQANLFFDSQKEKLSILRSMSVFQDAAMYPSDLSKAELAKKAIGDLKSIIPGISITTPEGIIIIGENDLPGMDYSGQNYYSLKEKKIVFERYYDPIRKKDYYAVAGPIYDKQEKDKIVGTIVFDVELDKISTLMKESLESKTNEVYIIDDTGLLLSGSEYIDLDGKSGVLVQEIDSEGAKLCLKDLKEYSKDDAVEVHAEEVSQYLNYMGNSVFGAHAYAPAINGCVIAEEGADEILGTGMFNYIFNIFSKK